MNPLKQGLRQTEDPKMAKGIVKVRIVNPLKQGLRLSKKIWRQKRATG